MEVDSSSEKRWNNSQAYGAAVACLALGIVAGYVVHGQLPHEQAGKTTPPRQAQPVSLQAAAQQVTPEQLRHMAEKAAEPLLARLQENPNDAALLAEIGKAYLYTREFQKATEYYERSAKIKADPRVLTTLGGAYHMAGADDLAINAWERALREDPGYADALYNLGAVKWQGKSDPAGAVEAWTTLLKKNPRHPKRAQVEQMIARAKQHTALAAR